MEAFNILPDPQTNGGLLIAVAESEAQIVIDTLQRYDISYTSSIGKLIKQQEKIISVKQ